MSPISKFEATGIFLSVAIMAVALVILRYETDPTVTGTETETVEQGAVIVASTETNDDQGALRNALVDAATPDGELVDLVIDDIRIGTGAQVKEGDTVSVHYIGSTQNGVQFDSSYVRGPFSFTVGEGKVIQGWEKGLIGMQVGGQRILVIPPKMAYGDRQVGPIPPGSPLVFAIELLEIK